MSLRAHRTTLIVFLAILLGFLILNATIVAPYLLAVLMGGILAVLCHPLYRRLSPERRPKTAASIVLIALIFLVLGPLSFFGWTAAKQGIEVGQSIARHQKQGGGLTLNSVSARLSSIPIIRRTIGDADAIEERVRSQLESASGKLSAALLAMLGAIPDQALQAALAMISCFFFLVDGRRFLSYLHDKIPMDRDVRAKLYQSFQDTAVGTILATISAGVVQGLIMSLAFWALGVPGAILAGGATFIFAWIPVLGSGPVWIGGTIYLFSQGETGKAIAMIIAGLICGVSDNFVRPMVLKGRGDMHPLVSLVAIFGGIQMFGIFGVFFGPTLMAILLSLLQVWPSVALRFRLVSPEEQGGVLLPSDVPPTSPAETPRRAS